MRQKITKDLLEKYLSGKCSEEEEALIDAWYTSLAEAHAPRSFPDDLESKLLEKVKSRIAGTSGESPFLRTGAAAGSNTRRWVLMAAASLGIIAAVAWWAVLQRVPDTAGGEPAASAMNYEENTGTAIRRIMLEDGTIVWLKPGSRIGCPEKFSARERKLTLTGEAFFSVAADAARPFSIATHQVVTRVVGTSFNIKAYEEAASVEVEVLTGKVSVKLAGTGARDADQAVLLTPHEKATYMKQENRLHKDQPRSIPSLAIWQPVDISFDNEPVREVLRSLTARFNIDIQVRNDDLLNCLIRADFNDQNLPDILEMLGKSIDASYQIKGETFYLTGEGCPD